MGWGVGVAQRPRGRRASCSQRVPGGIGSAGRASGDRAPLSLGWRARARTQHRGRLAKAEKPTLRNAAPSQAIAASCPYFPGSRRPGDPGTREAAAAVARAGSERVLLLPAARWLAVVVPSPLRFNFNPQVGVSTRPRQRLNLEPRRAGAGASPSQPHSLRRMLPSTTSSVYSRPSRSGKGHQSSEFGAVLRDAGFPAGPSLFSRRPQRLAQLLLFSFL